VGELMKGFLKKRPVCPQKAAEMKDAFLLQVAKDMGSMACVLNGKVDQIIVTGGIAYNSEVIEADRSGVSPYDMGGPAVEEIRAIKNKIDAEI